MTWQEIRHFKRTRGHFHKDIASSRVLDDPRTCPNAICQGTNQFEKLPVFVADYPSGREYVSSACTMATSHWMRHLLRFNLLVLPNVRSQFTRIRVSRKRCSDRRQRQSSSCFRKTRCGDSICTLKKRTVTVSDDATRSCKCVSSHRLSHCRALLS